MPTNARRLLYLSIPALAAVAAVVMAAGVGHREPQARRADAPQHEAVQHEAVPLAAAPWGESRPGDVARVVPALQPVAFQQAEEDEDAPRSSRNVVPVYEAHIILMEESFLATDRPGVIASVKPTEGDIVEEGELLVELRAEEAKAQLALARQEESSDVNKRFARAQLRVAQAELDMALSANRNYSNAVSQVEVDRLEFTRDRADLQIEQAIHEEALAALRVDEAQARVDASEIRAPFSGVVTKVEKNVGEAVGQGDRVIQLRNTERVKVEGYVSVAQSRRLKRGMPVEVHLDSREAQYDANPHHGTLRFVDVGVDPINRMARVWAEVENPNNDLRAGLGATMYIELPEGAPPAPVDEPPPRKPRI